jgi:hypothetical protein
VKSGDELYEVKVKLGAPTEFGVSMEALAAGQVAPPAEGARFDVSFEGSATGKIAGSVVGVDHLRVRADGRFDLHIHAALTTESGETVALFANGVAVPRPNSSVFDLKENVSLHSSCEGCTWVNGLQVWASGTADLAKQEVHIKGRVA